MGVPSLLENTDISLVANGVFQRGTNTSAYSSSVNHSPICFFVYRRIFVCKHLVVLKSGAANGDPLSSSISWHHVVLRTKLTKHITLPIVRNPHVLLAPRVIEATATAVINSQTQYLLRLLRL